MKPAKRVAVIGLGPAGAITIDALAQEQAFDTIRLFERREAPGGCWLGETKPPPILQPAELPLLAARTADPQHPAIPAVLPSLATSSSPGHPRYAESTVYPYLETNVDYVPMQYTQEPFPAAQTPLSRALHGEDTPFRHWSLVRDYVASLVDRRGYDRLVSYNTTVERAEKVQRVPNSAAAAAGGGERGVKVEKEGKEEAEEEWKLTLRKSDPASSTDSWWEERFDALVVASGHYSVPYIPPTPGLAAFAASRPPGSVIHSKHYRGRAAYLDRTVVVVGASVSAADIATDLTAVARAPVTAVVLGHTPNGYFGAEAFEHPLVRKAPSIARVDAASRTVHFVDGSSVSGVDDIIFGTGYTWTLPFFDNPPPSPTTTTMSRPGKKTAAAAALLPTPRNNRIPNLYLHTIYTPDPTILFVGAVNAGLTFKVFEYQAVLAARLLAGRVPPDRLPDAEAQRAWEADRVASRGDGPRFALVFPDFPDYFETLRRLAGPPTDDGKGRRLPPYNPFWFERFMAGHERRKAMWRRLNAEAKEALGGEPRDGGQGDVARAKL
ncbi:Putative flavin monooxygenase, FAD/NAD(P)-binding domain superfamily [Colletotrichum destructivum]|uniref:Flavin monooxygenase, FAD/NAD(P)-binding domain superfamily n=1 Tax=Colletotrichum destructivum TaxID=34406 RepID=A0AAX4IDK0_9PEZI|nr:Putative flavin monooxygenase, FAD/NAD(P)-binding domain superfamily [Colletotrichum destructivum]